MKMKRILALAVSFALVISVIMVPLAFVVNAEATEPIYFVNAVSGSDENDGLSEGTPLATIDKAQSLIAANDTEGVAQNGTVIVVGTADFDGGEAHKGMITIKAKDSSSALNRISTVGLCTELQGPTRFDGFNIGWDNGFVISSGYAMEVINSTGKNRIFIGNVNNAAEENVVFNDSYYGSDNDRTTVYIGAVAGYINNNKTQKEIKGVNFHFVNGRLAQLRISDYNTYTGNVNLIFDNFGCDSSGVMEIIDGTNIEFQKAFQLIINNGKKANIQDLSVFENGITATEGEWFIYGDAADDGSVLRATDVAGKYIVDGGLIANAYKVVDGVETSTPVKSVNGILDLSGAQNSGKYNVKYTLPEVSANEDATVYVSADGKDYNDGLTPETAFGTIDFAQRWLNVSTAKGEKTIIVIGTVNFDGGEPHNEMITIKANDSTSQLNRIATSGTFTELQGPTRFDGFNLGWDNGFVLTSGYATEYKDLSGRNRIFVGNIGNGGLENCENVIFNDSYYTSDYDRTTVYIGGTGNVQRTVAGVNFHFVNGRLAQLRISNNNTFTENVNLTFDKFGCDASGVMELVDGSSIRFEKAFQLILNNGKSKNIQDLSVFEKGITAKDGAWFMYSAEGEGTVLRATDTAGIFKVEGNLIANAYKVVDGVETSTPVKSENGILDLSGVENAGVYKVTYITRPIETNNDSVVYVSNNGSDLFDGKTAETALGSLEFAFNWLAQSTAEDKKIILSGEHDFVNVAYDDMVTITSENGNATIKGNNIKAGGPVIFDNITLLGWLYSNGNEVVFNKNCILSSSAKSGFVVGSDSAQRIDKVIINGSGLYGFAGAVRIGASKTVASYGLDLTIGGGNFSQFIFSDWAAGGTHYGDVNITFNGAIGGDCGGKISYNTTQVFNGALQFILNGVSPTTIDDTVYNIDAKDGEWFMFGERTAKLSTTEKEGEFTVSGAKYAKALNLADQSVYYSENGVLKVPQGSYKVTYFNSFKKGDANGDGDIDIRDLIGIKEAIANLKPFDLMIDLNDDNSNSAADTIKLKKHLLCSEKIVWEDTLNYLSNTYTKLVEDKKLNVAFMGGSVTDGYGSTGVKNNGWPTLICNWLSEKYDAEITESRQSIGGTGSYFGAFRYSEDIKTTPDLFFIEFAINDRYEGYTYEDTVKYSETIVRNALEMNPNMDIIYVLTFDRDSQVKTADYETLRAHRDVANKYGFLCIKLADKFYQIMDENGTKDYDYIPDGVHPNDDGYEFYSQIIIESILSDLPANNTEANEITEKVLPDAMSNYYENPHMLLAKDLEITSTDGWYIDTEGKKFIELRYGGSVKSSIAGSKFSFQFDGKDFGILYHADSYIGSISVSIDGEEPIVFNGYYHNPNPKTKFIIDDLQDGKHTVEITLLDGSFIIPAFFIN